MTNFGEDSQISSNGQRQPAPTRPHHPSLPITTLMQRWFFFFFGGAKIAPLGDPKKGCESYKVFFWKTMAQSRLILRKNKLKSPNLDHRLLLGYRQNIFFFF
jgi:hypothetical protein